MDMNEKYGADEGEGGDAQQTLKAANGWSMN
jgi:hypothetical protein